MQPISRRQRSRERTRGAFRIAAATTREHAWRAGRAFVLWLTLGLAVAGVLAPGITRLHAQGRGPFMAVGVQYQPASDPKTERRDLEEIHRLRFNVVDLVPDSNDRAGPSLVFIDRLLAGSLDPRVPSPFAAPVRIAIGPETSAGQIDVEAWSAVARGARAVIFDGWTTLLANAEALTAAAHFAEGITRNQALYAPLGPADTSGMGRRVEVREADAVEATLLESADALVLIAMNRSARDQRATLAFSPDVPEAIWQNMLTGGGVSFVAGPKGPVYERTFPPHEVIVLAIKTGRT